MKKAMKKSSAFLLCLMLLSGPAFAQEEGILETLKFKDADVRVVLQAITQKATRNGEKVNILVGPDIGGMVTVDLENVGWQTALEAVLKTYNYGYEWIGKNIILVDTLDKLAERREKEATSKVAEPLDTRVITLNFAKVEDIRDTIQKMLTARGRLTYDKRTNTIVVTDTQTNLTAVEEALKALDEITPQVFIEAKVVETDLNLTQQLGVNWNMAAGVSGAKRPTTWPFSSSSDNRFLVDDFPGTTATGSTGDFAYGTLNASTLSATLELIFNDTNTKILSMPKITTVDNNTAKIDVITKDPVPDYTYNAEQGAWEISGYEWIEYGVSLEVTPQINKEGFITLTVKPEVSENSGTRTFTSGGSGSTISIPILDMQTTTTKVMIKDGETLVLGGLIRDRTVDTVVKVPLFGDIPLLGYFFKHKTKTVVKKNLLIFITPTIVTPQLTTAE